MHCHPKSGLETTVTGDARQAHDRIVSVVTTFGRYPNAILTTFGGEQHDESHARAGQSRAQGVQRLLAVNIGCAIGQTGTTHNVGGYTIMDKPQFIEDLDFTQLTPDDMKRLADVHMNDKKRFLSLCRNPELVEQWIKEGYDEAEREDREQQAASESNELVRALLLAGAPFEVVDFWRGMTNAASERAKHDAELYRIKPDMDKKLNKIVELLEAEYGEGLREFMKPVPEPEKDNADPFAWEAYIHDDPVTESDIGKIYRKKEIGESEESIYVEWPFSAFSVGIECLSNMFEILVPFDIVVEHDNDRNQTKVKFVFYDVYDELDRNGNAK